MTRCGVAPVSSMYLLNTALAMSAAAVSAPVMTLHTRGSGHVSSLPGYSHVSVSGDLQPGRRTGMEGSWVRPSCGTLSSSSIFTFLHQESLN